MLIRSHDWPLLAAPVRPTEEASMNAISKHLLLTPAVPQPACSRLTFAELIELVGNASTLTDDQKRYLVSDLRAAAAMLELPPAAVPCDVVWLAQRLFR